MDIEKEKVYQAWPSGPPTYQQANSEHLQEITHNRGWNYSLFSCFEPGSLCTYRLITGLRLFNCADILLQASWAAVSHVSRLERRKLGPEIQSYLTIAIVILK